MAVSPTSNVPSEELPSEFEYVGPDSRVRVDASKPIKTEVNARLVSSILPVFFTIIESKTTRNHYAS